MCLQQPAPMHVEDSDLNVMCRRGPTEGILRVVDAFVQNLFAVADALDSSLHSGAFQNLTAVST